MICEDPMNPTTRREALILIASTSTAAAQQPHEHGAADAAPAATYRPKTLTSEEWRLAAVLSDLILPRTDTPGASDAGVPEFIDRRLTASAGLTQSFRRGLALLPPGFATLAPERQVAVLTEWSE